MQETQQRTQKLGIYSRVCGGLVGVVGRNVKFFFFFSFQKGKKNEIEEKNVIAFSRGVDGLPADFFSDCLFSFFFQSPPDSICPAKG